MRIPKIDASRPPRFATKPLNRAAAIAPLTTTLLALILNHSAQAQPNNPATGQPTISGDALVGSTLTVNTDDISDTDGLANAA